MPENNIPDEVNGVRTSHYGVVVVEYCFVHLSHGGEWSIAIPNDVGVVQM